MIRLCTEHSDESRMQFVSTKKLKERQITKRNSNRMRHIMFIEFNKRLSNNKID